jgi:5'(3')-deoxyribonucleotidase
MKDKKGAKKMAEKMKIYFDMDGVLADFNAEPNAVDRFAVERDFFKNLEPRLEWLNKADKHIRYGFDVMVITASPHERADNEKRQWLQRWLPELPLEKVFICRIGENKADHVPQVENAILYDDYGKNCKEWENAGGIAIKVAQ